jgi:hypothetical protein
MEERRNPGARDDFLEKFYKLEVAVERLTEHEKLDKPRYEQWHKETSARLNELERMRLDTTNGRLRDLENRPIIVQLTKEEIKVLFNEWGEILAGRLSFKFILSVAGAFGFILTTVIAAAVLVYFKFKP